MMPPERIDHPSAWYGPAMMAAPKQWSWTLTGPEIDELEGAAAGYLAGGADIGQLTAANFSLPTLGPKLGEMRRTLRDGIGFQLVRGLPVERLGIEATAAIFCGIGAHLGSARSQNARGHVLGHVRNVDADITDPTVRLYQTTERQTFHTDSTDVVALLCLAEAMEGGDSLLVSTVTLHNEMRRRYPDLAPLLFEPVATDRRGEVPEGMDPWFAIPVLNWHDGYLTGLYHGTYIASASRLEDAPKPSRRQREALDRWDDLTNDPALNMRMRLAPGDMQFVYNHHLMHDRMAFRDWPGPARRRHLLRLWLSLPDDRPLPEAFAQRYGTIEVGNRGGIVLKGTELNVSLVP